eukprot:6213081-Pleurochrysis_carterae.AAC.2
MPAIWERGGSRRASNSKRLGVGRSEKVDAITKASTSCGRDRGSCCRPRHRTLCWASSDRMLWYRPYSHAYFGS